MPDWIDAHCHLADPRLHERLDAVVERSRAAGVTAWVQGGVDPEDWDRQRRLRERFGAAVVPVFGLHPWAVAARDDAWLDAGLTQLECALPEAVALGELGLDFVRERGAPDSRRRQERAFERQLALAAAAKKPLVLHVVHAHSEALKTLEKHAPMHGGIVHAFAGAPEFALRYVKLGLYLSIGGAATEDGRKALKESIKRIPVDRIVVETDSPDLEPADLLRIAGAIAALAGVTSDALLAGSKARLETLFFGNSE